MAQRRGDEWIFNPSDHEPLPAGTGVVFLAGPEGRRALERAAHA
jgi:uncharacterized protein with PhoU and TrkA domain